TASNELCDAPSAHMPADWPSIAAQSVLLVAALRLDACVYGTRHVNLTYAPSMSATPTAPACWGPVAVTKLADARSPREGTGFLLGKVRDEWGLPAASVLANQDPVFRCDPRAPSDPRAARPIRVRLHLRNSQAAARADHVDTLRSRSSHTHLACHRHEAA